MRLPSFRSLRLFPVLGSVLLATACSASGGGTLIPLAPTGSCSAGASANAAATRQPQITLGFRASSPLTQPDQLVTFDGTFQDRCAGVTLSGAGTLHQRPAPPAGPASDAPCLVGTLPYGSNQASGTFDLIVCDLGTLVSLDGDFLEIDVQSGPYAGYSVQGIIEQGNLILRP